MSSTWMASFPPPQPHPTPSTHSCRLWLAWNVKHTSLQHKPEWIIMLDTASHGTGSFIYSFIRSFIHLCLSMQFENIQSPFSHLFSPHSYAFLFDCVCACALYFSIYRWNDLFIHWLIIVHLLKSVLLVLWTFISISYFEIICVCEWERMNVFVCVCVCA